MSRNDEEFWKALVRGLAHESKGTDIILSVVTLAWLSLMAFAYFT